MRKNYLTNEILVSQRIGSNVTKGDPDTNTVDSATYNVKSSNVKEPVRSPTSLVFGYLNLFSDGVVSYIFSFDWLSIVMKESF